MLHDGRREADGLIIIGRFCCLNNSTEDFVTYTRLRIPYRLNEEKKITHTHTHTHM